MYKVYTVSTSYPVDMEGTPTMGIREIRADFGARVDAAFFLNEATIVTKNDKPRAAVIPYAWYEELLRLREQVAAEKNAH